jgi:glycosidase
MVYSVYSAEVQAVFEAVRQGQRRVFPSPQDWRDVWVYFLMLDRFNNPAAPPRRQPWDDECDVFQGGTFNGVREQLDYLKQMGVGAIWLTPVLKNCQFDPHSYHGYGIQNFLAVEPRYASDPEAARQRPELAERELGDLIEAAHDRGMYVIFDVVLNHAGDVFAYEGDRSEAPWRYDGPYTIYWRDGQGRAHPEWTTPPEEIDPDGTVFPIELRRNALFRRQGNGFSRSPELAELAGDFYSLKEFATGYQEKHPPYGVSYPVREALVRAYQYIIAKYDVDGYRIDTLKFIEPEFARWFGSAMHEFALSIGKKNFFTFGEVYDSEEKIARFIGRNPYDDTDLIGVDAALDFPLFFKLPGLAKGQLAPSDVIGVFENRERVQRGYISSQGEVSKYFVTFFDNHDQNMRFYYSDPAEPHRYDSQMTLALACLFTLQGIPCIYYGTEQGLSGAGWRPEATRQALWGKPGAFDPTHPFYRAIERLSAVRAARPALRYGRQYFRPISGDGCGFGVSRYPGGVLAYSRLLDDMEVVVVANTHTTSGWSGLVIVDFSLNPADTAYTVLYSNQDETGLRPPGAIQRKKPDSIRVEEVNGSVTYGPTSALPVTLRPMEVQILAKVR